MPAVKFLVMVFVRVKRDAGNQDIVTQQEEELNQLTGLVVQEGIPDFLRYVLRNHDSNRFEAALFLSFVDVIQQVVNRSSVR